MSVHWLVTSKPKTLAESAACFGCAIAGLAGAAVALQWALGLVG
ncbi:MAG: hypothetical protein AB1942_03525 [Pseudomonadota bacterium]|jgi:hypothetical protein|nr:hypothetical protein [Phenylobacterium kunshanense]